ncbi:MAG: large-conductance mechanosensitive channel protein MscL [Caulobacteraceae bacterium]|nr:large-conductance mechanosensitive channel protein MscL [Caulobacteraceae bacterium]
MPVKELAARGRGFFGEFREFAIRGNVVDLAVGVIIGAAFGKIVTTLVDNVIMPPIGLLVGKVDFAHMQWVLKPDNPLTKPNEAVVLGYGLFINAIVQFTIVAFVVFLLVRAINRVREMEARKPEGEASPPPPTPTETLLMEIRDELRRRPPAGKKA